MSLASSLAAGLAAYASCDWRAHRHWLDCARALARDPGAILDEPRVARQALATSLADEDCAALIGAHLRHARAQFGSIAYPQTARLPRQRVRVGYLFDATHAGRSATLLAPVLRLHSRARFETFAYAIGSLPGNRLETPIAAATDIFRHIAHLRPHEAYGLMRCDDIDILVDTCGLASGHALQLGLYSPARACVSLLTVPSGEHAATQASAILPVEPQACGPVAPGARARAGLPEHGVVLCGFAAPEAIDPDAFATWMALLAACPDSVLWLGHGPAPMRANLCRVAGQSGVDPQRLVFCADQAAADCLPVADLFLDTLPAGSDALASALGAGVPVLSIAGSRLGARPGAATLQAAGLGDCVAADARAALDMAVTLCSTPAALAQVRMRFGRAFVDAGAQRLEACVRALEACYERIWERLSLASANGA